jgi:hypothetical protein
MFKFSHGYCAREIVIVGVSVALSGILAAFFFVCSSRTAWAHFEWESIDYES